MGTMVDTIENSITPGPEAVAQPGTAPLDDTATEARPTEEIADLWSHHARLRASRKAAAEEMRATRASLAERLHRAKGVLARPGRNGQWSAWLKQQGISRGLADRLVRRFAAGLPGQELPQGATPDAGEDKVERLCTAMWPRLAKTLKDDCAAYAFICRLAAVSEIGCELSDRGLLVLRPALEAAVAETGTTSPQPDSGAAGGAAAPLPEPTAAETVAAPADPAVL